MFYLYQSFVTTDLMIATAIYHPKVANSKGTQAPVTIKALTKPTLKNKLATIIERSVCEFIFCMEASFLKWRRAVLSLPTNEG